MKLGFRVGIDEIMPCAQFRVDGQIKFQGFGLQNNP
jgi:hypothetical protein